MSALLSRSIAEPIREGLSWSDLWLGPDRGLIWSWERGRQKRLEDAALAERAASGELVVLAWKGGVEAKLKAGKKYGSLLYLATWQGLRGEDLDVPLAGERILICSRTGQGVTFGAALPVDEE